MPIFHNCLIVRINEIMSENIIFFFAILAVNYFLVLLYKKDIFALHNIKK
jgi:hypothetical protein